MTSRLTVTRAQLRAIAAAAREEGCVAEVERDGVIYRLTPEALARPDEKEPEKEPDVDSGREINL